MPRSAVGTVGVIAQLGERFNGIEEVVGSIPSGSTTLRLRVAYATWGVNRAKATLGEGVPPEAFAKGFLPPRLFDQIRIGILDIFLKQRGNITPRD